MDRAETISAVFITRGLPFLSHHYVFWRRIVDIEDKVRYECFEAVLLNVGLTLLGSDCFNRRESK